MPAKNLIGSAFNYPEIPLAAGIGLYWLATPRRYYDDPRLDRSRNKGLRKYGKLLLATFVPTALDYLGGRNWHQFPAYVAADVAVPDGDPNAREKEQYIRDKFAESWMNNAIRTSSRIDAFYDVLDFLVGYDNHLLPKYRFGEKMPDSIPTPSGGIPTRALKGREIDLFGLSLSLIDAMKLEGPNKPFRERLRPLTDFDHLRWIATAAGAEVVSGPLPTVSAALWFDLYERARQYADEYRS